ncbi:PASTA domain-containing protein [Moorella sp. ACPs]|uniref:PASTA domain-containing protein n=1 Tax=Neomoorella carbonis TaxID=3062783 RepID=UPI003245F1F8
MEVPDCLGYTLAEAKRLLAAGGWQVHNYSFTGPLRPFPGEEEEGRVVRLRLVGAGQVDLVLAYVNTHHQ